MTSLINLVSEFSSEFPKDIAVLDQEMDNPFTPPKSPTPILAKSRLSKIAQGFLATFSILGLHITSINYPISLYRGTSLGQNSLLAGKISCIVVIALLLFVWKYRSKFFYIFSLGLVITFIICGFFGGGAFDFLLAVVFLITFASYTPEFFPQKN